MATAQPMMMIVTTPWDKGTIPLRAFVPLSLTDEGDPGASGDSESVTDTFSRYLTEISRYPLLTADEELELGRRIQAGDASAKETLVVSNLRLVVHVAKTYHAHELTLLDLIQEGNLGLIRAAAKYEPRANNRFATYARYWIRKAISEALIERDRAMPLPEDFYHDQQRVWRVTNALSVALGRAPTAEETARASGVSAHTLARLAALPPRHLASLDAPLSGNRSNRSASGEQPARLRDLLADDADGASVEEQAEQHDEQTRLYALLRKYLTPRELAAVALRYLTFSTLSRVVVKSPKPLSHHQVAKHLGISAELARLIEHEALAKLRKALIRTPDGVMPRRKPRRRVRRA